MKIVVALIVLSAAFMSCKSHQCGKYYDKMKECDIPTFGISKDEFVEKCKEADGNDEYIECADKSSCSDFVSCVEGI
jgi:hypothetical protein